MRLPARAGKVRYKWLSLAIGEVRALEGEALTEAKQSLYLQLMHKLYERKQ